MNLFSRDNPFIATLQERTPLCKGGTSKNTQHIVLNIENSGITYTVGDCIGILPSNASSWVDHTLQALKASPDLLVTDRDGKGPWPLWQYLTHRVDIQFATKKILLLFSGLSSATDHLIEPLLHSKEALEHEPLWHILKQLPCESLPLQTICSALPPLLPRFYSIASSQNFVGDEIHLTVAPVAYEMPSGTILEGVCSQFLNTLPIGSQVPIYIHPHRGFTLPEESHRPLIMIGPGTGIAPFRAFMQERLFKGDSGKNWLFFGEWTESCHFFYEEFWKILEAQGLLKLSTAFSRDQAHKIYVHHKMMHEGKDLFNWIEEGAIFYVCGDAKGMAKDVDQTLHTIIEVHGGYTPEHAKEKVKQLRKEGRYLRDVY